MKKASLVMSLLLALSLLAGCGADAGEASVQSVSMICGMGNVGMVNRFSGLTTSMGETKVQKSDNLKVLDIKVEVGDRVNEGDVLFTYDTAQTKLDLESKKLDLELQQNTLEDQKKQKEELEKEKEEVPYDQQLSYSREIRKMEIAIQESAIGIKKQQQEITTMTNQINNSSVKSPITGTIKSINENGAYDDYGNQLPFMTIVETDGFRVMGYVNEANIYALSLEQRVIIHSRVTSDTWGGVISSIEFDNPVQNQNYYGDSTSASSKYPFYVTLDSCEHLMLGQHVYIEPDNGTSQSDPDASKLHLPSFFIVNVDSNPYVWAQDSNGKLEKRNLTLGTYDADMDTYVIESGLTVKDYIAYPDDTLTAGMKCVTFDESNFSSDNMDGMMSDGMMPDGMISDGMVSDDAVAYDAPMAEPFIPESSASIG